MDKPKNNFENKPIVYIDLLETLAIWVDESDGKDPNQGVFTNRRDTKYTEIKKIFCGVKPLLISYDTHCPVDSSENAIQDQRAIALLEKHKEILEELRQSCSLRLISSANRLQTLNINEAFNLGFDKREILTKEDLPANENEIPSLLTICPEALLISNKDKDSKNATIKRQLLGIEREQQVALDSIEIKCMNIDPQEVKVDDYTQKNNNRNIASLFPEVSI